MKNITWKQETNSKKLDDSLLANSKSSLSVQRPLFPLIKGIDISSMDKNQIRFEFWIVFTFVLFCLFVF